MAFQWLDMIMLFGLIFVIISYIKVEGAEKSPEDLEREFIHAYSGDYLVKTAYKTLGIDPAVLKERCEFAYGKKYITAKNPFTVTRRTIKYKHVQGELDRKVDVIQCANRDEFCRESVNQENQQCLLLLEKDKDDVSRINIKSEKCDPNFVFPTNIDSGPELGSDSDFDD